MCVKKKSTNNIFNIQKLETNRARDILQKKKKKINANTQIQKAISSQLNKMRELHHLLTLFCTVAICLILTYGGNIYIFIIIIIIS